MQSFKKMSAIIATVFLDNYKEAKHLLPSGTTIDENSAPSEIAEAIFSQYEVQARLLSPMDLCPSWNIMVMARKRHFTCMSSEIIFIHTCKLLTRDTDLELLF